MVNHGILVLLILLPVGCLALRAVTRSQSRANATTCQTPACHDIAEELEHGMNTSVDPCENFYEFVCGTWLSKHRDGEDHQRKFEAPDKIVEKRVKEILESDFNSKYPPVIFEAITFYNQCKALNMEDATVVGQVYDLIKSDKLSKFGGWPLITPGWKESDFDLEKALIFMHKDMWINALYDVDVLFSEGPGKRGKIQLSVDNPLSEFGRLTTSTEFWALLLVGGIMESKMESIKETAAKFYIKDENFEENRQFKRDIKSIKKFSLQLTEIATTDSDDDEKMNETYTLSEIQSTFHEVNWMNFFQSVFGDQVMNGSQTIHANKGELQKLSKLLKRTNKRTVANYVIWRFLSKYTERFTDCVDGTKDAFVHAVGAVYLQRYLDQHMFDEIVGYIDDVRSVFDQLLDTASWMDNATRERAKRKLRLIKSNVGCPQIYRDVGKLKEFHKGLTITQGSGVAKFLKNVDSTFKFQSSILKENWADRKIDYLYHEGCIATNAAYNPLENSIAVFVGIIIEPFYHPHRPLSMNYGSVGYFIGHELTHAFDQEGRAFDEYGNQANWWTNRSAAEYDKRYQCYLQHYALVAENSRNATEYSEYTASENIADGGGLHEAYAALKKAMQHKQSANQRLPGIMNKYSPEQLFFLSFANGYCAYFPEGIKKLLKYTDPHSMDPNRVIGNIMNSRGFAEAFKCPVGSKMNPAKKCSLFE